MAPAEKRVGDDVQEVMSLVNHSMPDVFGAYDQIMSTAMFSLMRGLRELHDRGYVHLQTHMGNFYHLDGQTYLVDWTTMQQLGEHKTENVLNRSNDIMRVQNDYDKLLEYFFRTSDKMEKVSVQKQLDMIATYTGNPRINMSYLEGRLMHVLNKWDRRFAIVVQCLKDSGIEDFPKFEGNLKPPVKRKKSTKQTKKKEKRKKRRR